MTWTAYPAFRESRVQWLGALPQQWEVRNPKTLFVRHREAAHEGDRQLTASQADGVVFQDEFMEERGARVVQVIEGQAGLKHVSEGDFVISLRSFQGGIEFSAVSGKISPAYTVLSPRPEAHRTYFTYLLKSQGFIQELRSTSNQLRDGQSLGMEHFAQVPVPLPPPDEQAAIARMLDEETSKIDALIAKQEQLIATLREDRTAIITHAVTKGLDPDVAMKDSGVEWLGDVPAHWIVDRIKRSVESARNGIWGAEPDGGLDDIRCVRVADFDRPRLNIHDRDVTFRNVNASERKGRTLRSGDLLLEKSGGGDKNPVGFVVMYESEHPAVCSNFVARVALVPRTTSEVLDLRASLPLLFAADLPLHKAEHRDSESRSAELSKRACLFSSAR